ncbi:RNA pseudouridine synthase, partial [Stenotrophomonas maltophilia]
MAVLPRPGLLHPLGKGTRGVVVGGQTLEAQDAAVAQVAP